MVQNDPAWQEGGTSMQPTGTKSAHRVGEAALRCNHVGYGILRVPVPMRSRCRMKVPRKLNRNTSVI